MKNMIKMLSSSSKIGLIVFLIFINDSFSHAASIIPEPTQIIRTQVTTFSYGGFGQIQKIEEISKRSISSENRLMRFRRMTPEKSSSPSELFKNDPDPFSIPEIESYPAEDLKSSNANGDDINQQDPRVQEVDVVGWFE